MSGKRPSLAESLQRAARQELPPPVTSASESAITARRQPGRRLLCGDACREKEGHGYARPRHAQAAQGSRRRTRYHDGGAVGRGNH